MAKPKLALVPAAQGSKFYSVLPSSGVGDFNFTRSGSATRINSQGLIETVASGVSRLNYPMIDGVVKGCPHHILEPQRTNLIPYSEDFSQWTASALSVTDNNAISPDGTLNASKLTAVSGTVVKRIQEIGFSTTSTDRCYSIFVKTDDIKAIQLLHSGDLQGFARFDLVDYTVGSVGSKTTATIEDYGNGWYKCTAIFNSTNAFGSSLYLYFNDSAIGSYGGSSSQVGDLFIYGAQYEQGSYPTSYIPTSGATVTRSAETANGSGSAATFNSEQGVLMFEGSALANDGTFRILSLSNGGTSNEIKIQLSSVDNTIGYGVVVGGFPQIDRFYTTNSTLLNNKIAAKYKENDFSLFVNGFEVIVDTNGSVFSQGTLNELSFERGNNTSPFYSSTKQLQYYDTVLTDSELETLTSWTSFTDMAEGQLYTIE